MSCFGGKDEQIYLVEVTVDRLRLTADKYQEEFSGRSPVVKLKFIDFPVFVISNRVPDSDSSSQPAPSYDEEEGLLYARGKSCLFVYKPRDLIAAMQSHPLKLGIFRGEETYAIAEASISLSGCLCNLMAMVNNDEEHQPKPYLLEGSYNLFDPGSNHAGNITIYFRLSFFGTYIISDYQLNEDNYIFQNNYDGKLRVTRSKTRKQSGVQRLRKDDSNDQAHFMPTHCAPGSTKNDGAIARMRGGGSSKLNFFADNTDFTWYNNRFTMPRLEGGGTGGDSYPTVDCCGKATGKQKNNHLQDTQENIYLNNTNPGHLTANKCKLKHIDTVINKPVCSCSGKNFLESNLKKKGQKLCIKKAHLGADHIIKAFKETQDFVDSIGKVPGLAGLGILESPYFGKSQEIKNIKNSESKSASINKKNETNVQFYSPQNFENLKKQNYNNIPNTFTSTTTEKPKFVEETNISLPDPLTQSVSKSRKKDEKIDKVKETENNALTIPNFQDTPCGEPTCKSRPKQVVKAIESTEDFKEKVSKISAPLKNDKKPKTKSHIGSEKTDKSLTSKKNNQFIYSFGNTYPISVYGHKDCNFLTPRVPAHMGWMWNKTDQITKLKPLSGWRPGAISMHLRDILREAKEGFFKESNKSRVSPMKSKKGKSQKSMNYTIKKTAVNDEEEIEENNEFPPTLHIHRKNGIYYVTMYPIRPETSTVPRLDEPINPLQFKIVKSKCSITSSSIASDMEIEFSPPAAVNRMKKKPNVVHVNTQVKQDEILDEFKISDSKKDKKSKKDKTKKK